MLSHLLAELRGSGSRNVRSNDNRIAKIVVAGEDRVGKSSLISALVDEIARRFEGETTTDPHGLHMGFKIASPNIEGSLQSRFAFWEDTYNQPSRFAFRSLIHPNTDVFLICLPLDVLRERPADVLDQVDWELEKQEGVQSYHEMDPTVTLLVGVRKDLVAYDPELDDDGARAEPVQLSSNFADPQLKRGAEALQNKFQGYVECSSRTGEGVPVLFDTILKALSGEIPKPRERSKKPGKRTGKRRIRNRRLRLQNRTCVVQ